MNRLLVLSLSLAFLVCALSGSPLIPRTAAPPRPCQAEPAAQAAITPPPLDLSGVQIGVPLDSVRTVLGPDDGWLIHGNGHCIYKFHVHRLLIGVDRNNRIDSIQRI